MPIEILEYRNEGEWLHGVVTWQQNSMFFIMVDPACRRQGIATKLMQEAVKRWPIVSEKQRYTRDGAKFFRAFINRTSTSPMPRRESNKTQAELPF